MSNIPPSYPFDPSGIAPTNLVQNEQHVVDFGLTVANTPFLDRFTFIPKAAPFFAESLSIGYRALDGNTRLLVEGTDYLPTNHFIGASRATTYEIYGSITIINTSLTGTVTCAYQTLGGSWTIGEDDIAAALADAQADPRVTAWEQVVNLPYQFPVINHPWHLNDLVGASELRTALEGIITAITTSITTGLTSHLNESNPHNISAASLGTLTASEISNLFTTLALPIVAAAEAKGGLVNGVPKVIYSISKNAQGQITAIDTVNLPISKTGTHVINAGAGTTKYTVIYDTPFPDNVTLNPPVLGLYDSSANASVYGGIPVLTNYSRSGFQYVVKSYLAAPNDKLAGITYIATSNLS